MNGLDELISLIGSRSTAVLLVGGAAAALTIASWIVSDVIGRTGGKSGRRLWPRYDGGHGHGGGPPYGHNEPRDDYDHGYGDHGHGPPDDDFEGRPKFEPPSSSGTHITININLDPIRDTLERIEDHVSPTRKKRIMDLVKNTFFAVFGSLVSILLAAIGG